MLKPLLVALLVSSTLFASSCKDLDTDAKIRAFVKETYKSNPLLRENVSASLEIKTNDKGTKEKTGVHVLRKGDNKRSFMVSGKHAPKCSISKGERSFLCSECTHNSNALCRAYKGDESSTTVPGTNIDTNDFAMLESDAFQSSCSPVKKKPNFVKITSKKVKGDSPYNKIIAYYDMSKKIAVTTNYFADNVLRKVYRFFPKYYKQIKGEWISTVSRVRTVAGKEKKFSFETLIFVQKKGKNAYELYTDPKEDKKIAKRLKTIFNTNK